jgi:DNA-binding beta-propeller fold protein YncE
MSPGPARTLPLASLFVGSLVVASLLGLAAAGCDREVIFPHNLSWEDPPLPDYIGQARLGLTNNSDDTLAFVTSDSIDQPRLLGKVKVGNNPIEIEGPHHLATTADGRFIFFNLSNYVVNGGSGPHGAHGTGKVPGYLVKLDARTNRPVGQVLIDRSPGDVILSADGKLVFVSHYDLARLSDQLSSGAPKEEGFSKIAIVNADTMELLAMKSVCPTAHGQGLSRDGKRLYVTCSLSDELAVLDVS